MSIPIMALGVAAPIINPKFQEGTHFRGKVSGTINADATSGTFNNINVPTTNYGGVELDKILLPGDIVELGPSTNTTYKGLSELATVRNVDGNTITFINSLRYPYADSDCIKGIGRALAGGWGHYVYPSVPPDITMLGIHNYPPRPYSPPHILKDYLGHMNYQKFEATTEGLTSGSRSFYIFQYFVNEEDRKYRPLMENTIYRFGMYYKVSFEGGSNSNKIGFWSNDGEGGFFTLGRDVLTYGDLSSQTVIGTFSTGETGETFDDFYARAQQELDNLSIEGSTKAIWDMWDQIYTIYLERYKSTDYPSYDLTSFSKMAKLRETYIGTRALSQTEEEDNYEITKWHFYNNTASTSVSYSRYGEQSLIIFLSLNYRTDYIDTAKASINSVFMEHAKMSDGEDNGVYYFTSDGTSSGTPILPDINRRWRRIESRKDVRLGEGYRVSYETKGYSYRRWRIDYNFTWVPESFLKNLDVFLTWQRMGHKLILHTGEDHLIDSVEVEGEQMVNDSGLPPFLIGNLQVNGSNRPLNDMTIKDLTITFIESEHGY